MRHALHFTYKVLAGALVLALGCATPFDPTVVDGEAIDPPITRELDTAISHSTPAPTREAEIPIPDTVSEALMPPISLTQPDDEAGVHRYDVTVENADAREFFMSLVEGTRYNVVLDPDISGQVTLALQDVTIEDVMDAVRDVYGYQFRKTAYGFHVMPGGLQTRVFQVDYLNVQRTGQSETRVSSGQVTQSGGDGGSGGGSSGGDGGQTSGSQISTSSRADFWVDLQASLESIVGSEGGRSVIAIPNAGIVLVRGMPGELRDVETFLNEAQSSLSRQVILEAKVLEVTLDDGFQAGINWAQLADLSDSARLIAAQTGGGSAIAGGASEIAGNTGLLDPKGPLSNVVGSETSAFGGVFTMAISSDNFSAFVELLETQGSVRTLSSPRVSTLNQQKAVIKVGQDEFFVTDVSSTTTTGTATTTTPDITLTPFFSGIALDVTPQISQAGAIILHIHPSISEVRDQTKTVTIADAAQTLPLALSTIRESDSVVRVRSGQVIVIGGLMQDNARDEAASTPWISSVPVVGHLFRQRRDSSFKNELVILLRAISVEPGTWKQRLEEARGRVEALEKLSQPGVKTP